VASLSGFIFKEAIMEKDILNGSGPLQEMFVIHDPANKRTINVRDATDEELLKAQQGAAQASKQLWESIQNQLTQFQTAAMANSVFSYEIDRRRRSIVIARIIQ
jgi:hypothetical protein